MNGEGGDNIFPIGYVQLMQHPIPGNHIGCVFAVASGSDHGSGGQATWAINVVSASTPDVCGVYHGNEMFLPKEFAVADIDCIDIVGGPGFDGDLFDAGCCIHTCNNERRKQSGHYAGLIVEVKLPEELHIPDVPARQSFFVLLPGGALGIPAIRQPIRCPNGSQANETC